MRKPEPVIVAMSFAATINAPFWLLLRAFRKYRRECFEAAYTNDLVPFESQVKKAPFRDEFGRIDRGAMNYAYVLKCHRATP